MKTQTLTTKTVIILVRYFVKATQTVICQVLNGEGKKYFVTLHANGGASCTCKHCEKAGNRAHCYHVKHVQSTEAARQEREIESERQDYLTLTHQTTQDTIEHVEAEQSAERKATFAALMKKFDIRYQQLATYDVLSEAVSIVQAAEELDEAYAVRAEQMRKDRERTAYLNASLSMGWE